MKNPGIILFTILFFFICKIKAQEPTYVWAKHLGGKSTDYVADGSIAIDLSKNIYTLGSFTDTADFNPGNGANNLVSSGNFDIFVSKLSSTGNYLWAKRIGGAALDYAFNIVSDAAGNIYINGYVTGVVDLDPGAGTFFTTGAAQHAFVVKLNTSGDFIWGKQFDTNSSSSLYQVYFNAMVLAKDGNLLAGGQFGGTVDFDPGAGNFSKTSAGKKDAFIFKLDTAGNFVWVERWGSINDDIITSIAIDPTGNIYTTGHFANTVDFDPGAGVFNLASVGNFDVFIHKSDANANFIWAKQMGGTSADYGNSITVDNAGKVYTTGQFNNTADFDPGAGVSNLTSAGAGDIFISKLDSNGLFKYALRKGDVLTDNAYVIRTDAAKNVYILGIFNGTVDFNPGGVPKVFSAFSGSDGFLLKLDGAGKYIWLQQYSASVTENCSSFIFDQNENIYCSGYFDSTIDMDPGAGTSNLVSNGNFDVYIQKLAKGTSGSVSCSGATTFTSCSGTFDDGSGNGNYLDNQNCSWLIQPTTGGTVNLSFNAFRTEANFDFVSVYDGTSALDPLIGSFSGNTIPNGMVSTGNSLFITFASDGIVVDSGFSMSWTCNSPSPPVANFSVTSQNITAGNSIVFTDLSTNSPLNWNWSFPGGTPASSSSKYPGHITYNTPGCYAVTLVVNNSFGFDTLIYNCYINVAASSVCSELIISEYIEGSNLNKVLELYNASSVPINLSSYTLKVFSNGSIFPSNTLNLSGTLAPQSTYVVANSAATAVILALTNTTSNICSFNGNDAVVLFKNNVGIDAVGIVGIDPGFSWLVPGGSTLNYTLTRKNTVSSPSTDWSVVQNQWNVLPIDDVTNLATHNIICGPQASFTYSTPVCENYAVAFTNTSFNATTYQWTFQGGSPATSTLTNPIVQFLSTGIKTITLIATDGINSDTKTLQITVNALPNAAVTANGPTSFCSGGNVTFTANSGTGLTYQWQKNLMDINGATAISYTASAAGSYRVVVTNSFGCQTASGLVPVTVFSNPSATITANGSLAICTGGSVQLSANTGANLSYVWKLNGLVISGATSSTYLATTAGMYKAIVTNVNGCSKISNTLTVSTQIATAFVSALGPVTVCNGTGVTLKANTGVGYTYKWLKGGNIIAGAIDSMYTAFVSGTYKVTVTSTCGTVTSSGIVVTINNLPVAIITTNGSNTICSGDSVKLTASTGVGLIYQWSKNGVPISGQFNSTYAAKTTGNYSVLITNANGCTAHSNIITVTVNSVSASVTANGPTSFCAGDSVKLTANSGTNLAYQWLKSNVNISGATSISYTAKTAANYKVKVTNTQSSCSKFSAIVQVVVNCRSIENNASLLVTVTPNPFRDEATLTFENNISATLNISIWNIEGKLIEEYYTNGEYPVNIGKGLQAGFYLVIIKQGNTQIIRRLVKI